TNHLLTSPFCNETTPTDTYTLSLHDALPIFINSGGPRFARRSRHCRSPPSAPQPRVYSALEGTGRPLSAGLRDPLGLRQPFISRSEEHTSELQSRSDLVCRLLLEKKKQ